MPFWQNLELLPSSVREKVRKAPKRSAKEYAETRKEVQERIREGRERTSNEEITAEVLYYIESNEEELKEKMSNEKLEDALADFTSYDAKRWGQMKQAFTEGEFDLSVDADDDGKPVISMDFNLPEGNIRETVQLCELFQENLVKRAVGSDS